MNYQELLQSPIIPPQIVALTQKASSNMVPVLIQGEQGTGKELIAKLIHYTGDWKSYRFLKMDCRIMTKDTFQASLSELLKETEGGETPATVYLKEVGYLGKESQLKLLELIEDGVLQTNGEKKVIKNIRFISSSSEDLKEKAAQGKFLEDLYYQLSTLSIFVPPLRDRTDEIPKIAQYILEEYSKRMRLKKVAISNDVLSLLESYWWPGNLRELEHVVIRGAVYSDGETLKEKDLFFRQEEERTSFSSFLKKSDVKPPLPKERGFSGEEDTPSLSAFLIELVHRIKNPLVSIKAFTQLLREKFNDPEFRNQYYRVVTEDIDRIDSLLNGFLNYIKINTPIEKRNTVHGVLDDVLKRHDPQLKDKQIKVFKRYEEGLPETIVHEEQLRYIFDSILQYAISSVPPNGSIGFLTKSSNTHKKTPVERALSNGEKGQIEIVVVFTGYKREGEPLRNVLGIPVPPQEEKIELELRLLKEIIQKNRGMMKFEVDEKKPRTLISLSFPIERRKVIYYPSAES
ncbi:MAG: sigma 54-interacting transcriptional regulator [Syntrophaceae bacterium]|nr:sigma 54-interacting transcriptional regulator [Syntrophaceae bacterium]